MLQNTPSLARHITTWYAMKYHFTQDVRYICRKYYKNISILKRLLTYRLHTARMIGKFKLMGFYANVKVKALPLRRSSHHWS